MKTSKCTMMKMRKLTERIKMVILKVSQSRSPAKSPQQQMVISSKQMKSEFTFRIVRTQSVFALILSIATFKDRNPFSFTLDRGDDETIQILYSKENDRFYQIQMASSENSAFIDRSILREVKIYIITSFNPLFLLVPVLIKSIQIAQSPKY